MSDTENNKVTVTLTKEELRNLIIETQKHALDVYFQDEHISKDYWERGFKHLSTHATNGVSQWIGKRILMILLAGLFSASVTWAVMTGRLK